jgi:hypothetical protein
MAPLIKEKNIGTIESVLRSVIGVILLVFAFVIEGIMRWVVGLIGVAVVVTALFGY